MRMVDRLLIVAVALAVVAAVRLPTGGAGDARPGTQATPVGAALDGEVVLIAPADWGEGAACRGWGTYGDVRQGLDVLVFDAAGAIVGAGRLGPPAVVLDHCTFRFSAAVPELAFYRIVVGRHEAGWWSASRLGNLSWRPSIEFWLGG